eukprot:997842-Amphidinium_carterae.1
MPGGRITQEHTHYTSISPPFTGTGHFNTTIHTLPLGDNQGKELPHGRQAPSALGTHRGNEGAALVSTTLQPALQPLNTTPIPFYTSSTTSTSLSADSLWTTHHDNPPLTLCAQQKQLKTTTKNL